MKSYMLALAAVCFSFSLSAQSKSQIEKAEKMIQDGLPKDAATLLKKEISTMPCADDMALYVKANILYVSALSQYEEDAIMLSINHLNETLPKCKVPATQIFHSYLGELYMQYRGYGGTGRKNLETPDDDISVWSPERIKAQAFHYFRASLQDPQQLFAIPITDYALLLTEEKYDETYRPTLYDVLAHRFFNSMTEKPLRTEYPALIGTLPDFLQMKAGDDASIKTFAIATWQQLLQLHEADADPTALIQADLDRINFFAPNNTVMDAYDYLLKKYDAHPAVALVAFQKAQLLNSQGMMIDVRKANATEKRSRVEAADICRLYARKFPLSDGGSNCATLLMSIVKQEITLLHTEPVLPPSQPALAGVEFRNLQRLTCMIYAVPPDKIEDVTGWQDDNAKKFLSNNRPVRQWEIEIPDPQDYLSHTTEFEIPPIDKHGAYLLLITPEPVFSIEKSLFVTQLFQVSSLYPIYTQTTGKTGSFTVTDRLTGLPLKGVSIALSGRANTVTVSETLTTDDNGMAYLSKDYNTSLNAVFVYKKDTLFLQQSLWNSRQSSQERKNYTSALLFTDRAVYRPGQTVYFKGVIIETSETKVVTVANSNVVITLRDVNYQEILKQNYTSNDLGGFDGTFTIPTNVLTGNMTLQTQNGAISFLVEEYKRPRFEVTFDKIDEVYALNEDVTVKGKAMMLNGLPLENATVNFQVARRIFRPFYYGYFHFPRFSPEQPIANGTVTTKADGTFEITFKTTADVEDAGHKFYYTFNITADVTDITGEMQSGSTNIAAGKKGLIINAEVPAVVTGKENGELKVSFKNYSGEVVPVSSATITIEELSQPKTAYINRLWAIPDLFIISKEDFTKKFPQYAYNSDSLPVAKRIYSATIENKATETVTLHDKLKQTGKYRITVSVPDKTGELTTEVKEFTFLKEGEKTFPIAQNALFHVDKKSVKAGEKVKIFAGSAAKNAKVFYTLITPAGVQKQQWMDVGKQPLWIEIATDATMIPALTVNMYLVQNNRFYEINTPITVTDPAKELIVEVTGIRDKTMPGAKERWEMKIADKDGKPISAALFATMYDAALDKFASLSWNFFASPNYRRASFTSTALTKSAASGNKSYNVVWNEAGFITPDFPAFDWFGFYFYASRFGGVVMNMNGMYMDAKISMSRMQEAPSAKGGSAMMAMDVESEAVADEGEPATAVSEPAPANNARQNFAETVFFYPDMRTDKDGNIILEFTMPETLTRWNMQAIGYTNTLQIGNFSQSIVTESDFMVMPNLPRFLRVGDTCVLTTRIANRTDKPLSGKAKIVIENMATGVSLQENVISDIEIPFTVNGNESIVVSWKYRQTDSADALLVRMTATSGNFTD
ncbi:MAG: MG2 domain-containing protein, partial [Bacteroidales bacterium]|nr:MG2 domain-containing protein [Bacteroidales bacterium]